MNTAIQTAWNQINRQFQEAASRLPNYFAQQHLTTCENMADLAKELSQRFP